MAIQRKTIPQHDYPSTLLRDVDDKLGPVGMFSKVLIGKLAGFLLEYIILSFFTQKLTTFTNSIL